LLVILINLTSDFRNWFTEWRLIVSSVSSKSPYIITGANFLFLGNTFYCCKNWGCAFFRNLFVLLLRSITQTSLRLWKILFFRIRRSFCCFKSLSCFVLIFLLLGKFVFCKILLLFLGRHLLLWWIIRTVNAAWVKRDLFKNFCRVVLRIIIRLNIVFNCRWSLM